jgi:hypothetical protein
MPKETRKPNAEWRRELAESLRKETRTLWREAKELNLIFGAIWRKR